jgi:signal transduction histidine kinase
MSHDRDPLDLLHELSGVVRAGTGARAVTVWLLIERMWVPAAGTPDIRGAEPVRGDLNTLGAVDLVAPIRHAGEVLGAITVTKPGAGPLNPLEQQLVKDLASQAGIVTYTVHLRENLRYHLEVSRQQNAMLVASRAQIVAAQDEERRRLERDIHDSCQQEAVVLAGRLGFAGTLAKRDPRQVRAVLEEACGDVIRLASALRRLTSAVPVPELAAEGVGRALRSATAGLPVAIDIHDAITDRYHPGVEAAAYFCAMETIQNATKHARASHIVLNLWDAIGCLFIRVRDDGVGFDTSRATDGAGLRNVRERLRPWQGRLTIHSSSAGTTAMVEIPVTPTGATS